MGLRFFIPVPKPLYPPMHDGKAMPFAILDADAFSSPTSDGVDDVGWVCNGTEAIPQTVPERVDDASIRHPWLQPFVQRRTSRVRIALGFAAVFGEAEALASVYDPVRCPE